MKKRKNGMILISFAGLAVILLLGGIICGEARPPRSSAAPFREGEFFPVRAFPSLKDGRPMSIADFRGKKVILHIFASW